jgi:hypothetical protein
VAPPLPSPLSRVEGEREKKGMNTLRPIFISGISIFGFTAALSAIAQIWFVRSARGVDKKYLYNEKYKVKWSSTQWTYETALVGSISFMFLYLLQYYGSGLAIKPSLTVIVWLRWLFYGVIGTIYMGVLNYAMIEGKHCGAQSFFSLLGYAAAIFSVGAATVAHTHDSSIVWMAASLTFMAYSISRVFWPISRLWTEEYNKVREVNYSETPMWRIMFGMVGKNDSHEAAIVVWAFSYKCILLANIILSYVGVVITWFLSDGNEFTDVSDLHSTLLAYLIFDIVFIVPFTILFSSLTFANKVQKASVKDKESGTHRMESRVATNGMLGK